MPRNFWAAVTSCVLLVGCASHGPHVVESNTMKLEDAICQVQNAIVATRRSGDARAGLSPSKATVVLELAAAEKNSREIKVAIPIGVAEWGSGSSSSNEVSRGNTLTIEFVNPAFAPTNTVVGAALDRKEPTPASLDAVVGTVVTHNLKPTVDVDRFKSLPVDPATPTGLPRCGSDAELDSTSPTAG